MAVYVAKSFLEQFEHRLPAADLKTARCTLRETGQRVFEIQIHGHAEPEAEEGDSIAR
jgi:hypothetical protein